MPNAVRPLPPLAIIAGPTACGKSALALALALADATRGVIINADSAQVYRDLRVVSARPDCDDEARAQHRLYGTRDGAVACSAADWAMDARAEIEALHRIGRLPVLVGGTGLYLRTLLDGIAPVPPIAEDVRARVRATDTATNHAALAAEDPAAAAALSLADTTRVARALEVVRSTGRSILYWRERREGGIGSVVRVVPRILLPPRDWLHARIDARFAAMLNGGGIEEIEALLARGLAPTLPVMNAIGVREIAALLQGRLTFEQATAAGQTATRQYAKRQVTWFRNQPPAGWPRIDGAPDVARIAADFAAAITSG